MEGDEEQRRKGMAWQWHVALWEVQSQQEGVRDESRYRRACWDQFLRTQNQALGVRESLSSGQLRQWDVGPSLGIRLETVYLNQPSDCKSFPVTNEPHTRPKASHGPCQLENTPSISFSSQITKIGKTAIAQGAYEKKILQKNKMEAQRKSRKTSQNDLLDIW